jgi:glutaredoxin 2
MTIISATIDDSESKIRLSKQAVKTCHKESGIPMPELISLIKRMTKEVKEITDDIERKMQEWEAA